METKTLGLIISITLLLLLFGIITTQLIPNLNKFEAKIDEVILLIKPNTGKAQEVVCNNQPIQIPLTSIKEKTHLNANLMICSNGYCEIELNENGEISFEKINAITQNNQLFFNNPYKTSDKRFTFEEIKNEYSEYQDILNDWTIEKINENKETLKTQMTELTSCSDEVFNSNAQIYFTRKNNNIYKVNNKQIYFLTDSCDWELKQELTLGLSNFFSNNEITIYTFFEKTEPREYNTRELNEILENLYSEYILIQNLINNQEYQEIAQDINEIFQEFIDSNKYKEEELDYIFNPEIPIYIILTKDENVETYKWKKPVFYNLINKKSLSEQDNYNSWEINSEHQQNLYRIISNQIGTTTRADYNSYTYEDIQKISEESIITNLENTLEKIYENTKDFTIKSNIFNFLSEERPLTSEEFINKFKEIQNLNKNKQSEFIQDVKEYLNIRKVISEQNEENAFELIENQQIFSSKGEYLQKNVLRLTNNQNYQGFGMTYTQLEPLNFNLANNEIFREMLLVYDQEENVWKELDYSFYSLSEKEIEIEDEINYLINIYQFMNTNC